MFILHDFDVYSKSKLFSFIFQSKLKQRVANKFSKQIILKKKSNDVPSQIQKKKKNQINGIKGSIQKIIWCRIHTSSLSPVGHIF